MKSENINELALALSKAQKAFKPIKKTLHVGYATKSGAKNYNYAPLDEVIDATTDGLSGNGLSFVQLPKRENSNIILETVLLHQSGQWVSSELYVGKEDLEPQALGSALTYMRRYALSAILGVASEEDDDAQEAEKKLAKKEPKTDEPGKEHKPVDTTNHYCQIHKVNFFKSKNMKSFAHSYTENGETKWCNEPEPKVETPVVVKQAIEAAQSQGQSIAVPINTNTTATIVSDPKSAKIPRDLDTINSITDLYKACYQDFKLQPVELMKILGISSWNELVISPKDAYIKIASTR